MRSLYLEYEKIVKYRGLHYKKIYVSFAIEPEFHFRNSPELYREHTARLYAAFDNITYGKTKNFMGALYDQLSGHSEYLPSKVHVRLMMRKFSEKLNRYIHRNPRGMTLIYSIALNADTQKKWEDSNDPRASDLLKYIENKKYFDADAKYISNRFNETYTQWRLRNNLASWF